MAAMDIPADRAVESFLRGVVMVGEGSLREVLRGAASTRSENAIGFLRVHGEAPVG